MAHFTALGSARATERFDVTLLKVKDLQEGFKLLKHSSRSILKTEVSRTES